MSINCWATSELGVKPLVYATAFSTRPKCWQGNWTSLRGGNLRLGGVNHTAWFTTFRRGDEDLIPRIREVMTERHLRAADTGVVASDELYAGGNERVRSELMALTGYFHTESSHHASEYWAWFRKSPDLVRQYISKRWDYYAICSAHSPDHNVDEFVEKSATDGLAPSQEYGAYIIDSMVTGTRRVIYGNVPNNWADIEPLAATVASKWPAWWMPSACAQLCTGASHLPAPPSIVPRSTYSGWRFVLLWRSIVHLPMRRLRSTPLRVRCSHSPKSVKW